MRMIRIIFLLSLFFLSACSTVTPKAPSPTGFNIHGLVGVTTTDSQNSANFNWYQSGAAYHIELYGPLALGTTYLDSDGQQVSLTLSNQQIYNASSPEILMQKLLGWSLPVEGLKYWILAQPVPNEAFTAKKDSTGNLQSLSQEGWSIEYTWVATQKFPHKITLMRPGIKAIVIVNKVE
jgi:outer membrane lipoprotein LolB